MHARRPSRTDWGATPRRRQDGAVRPAGGAGGRAAGVGAAARAGAGRPRDGCAGRRRRAGGALQRLHPRRGGQRRARGRAPRARVAPRVRIARPARELLSGAHRARHIRRAGGRAGGVPGAGHGAAQPKRCCFLGRLLQPRPAAARSITWGRTGMRGGQLTCALAPVPREPLQTIAEELVVCRGKGL